MGKTAESFIGRAGEIEVVCPNCKQEGSLVSIGRLDALNRIADGSVSCPSCGSSYPVVQGIPVLVPAVYASPLNLPGHAVDREHAGYDTLPTKKVASLARGLSDAVSLDVGCGKGPYTMSFNGDVVLTDVNFGFVREAVARESGSRALFGVVADARLLPFPPGRFEYILCSNILEHLSQEDTGRVILSLKEVTCGILQIDVPNDSFLLTLLRGFATKLHLFQDVEFEDPTLMHHASLAARDLKRAGFEVHGCAHWLSRERIRLGRLWDLYDAIAWRAPYFAGTLIGIYRKGTDRGGTRTIPVS